MIQNENNGFQRLFGIGMHASLSKVFKILEVDNDAINLNVAVYLPYQKKFLYCNSGFKKILGIKIDKLFELGWDYWFTNIYPEERLKIKNRVKNFFSVSFNRKSLTLRYNIYDGTESLICVRHEIVLHKVENYTIAINYFFDISVKEKIENYFRVNNDFNDAIIHKAELAMTSREKEVLQLVAEGFSSNQISKQLFISNHTVISHRKHLIKKFRVKNTAQLIKNASKIIDL